MPADRVFLPNWENDSSKKMEKKKRINPNAPTEKKNFCRAGHPSKRKSTLRNEGSDSRSGEKKNVVVQE